MPDNLPAVMELWACRWCRWLWPAEQLFCGVCGRGRALASAGPLLRMVMPS
jgi:hypothetical protein